MIKTIVNGVVLGMICGGSGLVAGEACSTLPIELQKTAFLVAGVLCMVLLSPLTQPLD